MNTRRMKWLVSLFAVVFVLCLVIPEDAWARRGGGGMRSFSRSRSSSWGSRSRSSAKRTTTRKQSATSTKKSTRSKADQAAYEKAVKGGTAFKSKDAAMADFKTKHGSKYGSKYDKKPATRPDHIPSTYSEGGRNYNVSYYPQQGGYGYMSSGRFILYNALATGAAVSLMSRHGYYYGDYGQQRTVYRTGSSFFGGLISLAILIGIVLLIVVIVRAKPAKGTSSADDW